MWCGRRGPAIRRARDRHRSDTLVFDPPGGRASLSEESLQRGEDAMAREFSVIIERDGDGYFGASVPALRGCHTQATSLDKLMARMREAVELCLEGQG